MQPTNASEAATANTGLAKTRSQDMDPVDPSMSKDEQLTDTEDNMEADQNAAALEHDTIDYAMETYDKENPIECFIELYLDK